MQNFLTFKRINLFGSFLAFILVVVAVAIQTQFNLEPCPLCVSQRIVFIVIGFLFFLFSFLKPNQLIKFIHVLTLLTANIVGIVFAIRHIMIQSKWITVPAECGIDLDLLCACLPSHEVRIGNRKGEIPLLSDEILFPFSETKEIDPFPVPKFPSFVTKYPFSYSPGKLFGLIESF